MKSKETKPKRYIGLDGHKHYLVAVGVDKEQQQLFGPQRVELKRLKQWVQKKLGPEDALVLEMSTNSFQLYDDLVPYVHSVTIVHPPHVKAITQAPVKTDRKAALILAKHLAAGLLEGVWVPDAAGRDLRAVVAQRSKMVRLSTQAKNRLQALLHRRNFGRPDQGGLFIPENRAWWIQLPLSNLEKVRMETDWATLAFALEQIKALEEAFKAVAGQDERAALLVQLPGISLISAVSLLAAIDDIKRFADAAHLVGYAGLGGRVRDSGQSRRTGGITKAGRRDIRTTMVEAAHTAVRVHAHWQAEFERLTPRLGKPKALVAIARKLLVSVWHILSAEAADRFAQPVQVARFLLQFAYRLGRNHRPAAQSPAAFVRCQLDRLGLGADLDCTYHAKRRIPLPPSSLVTPPA